MSGPTPKHFGELRNLLKLIFHPKNKWGDNQNRSFQLLRHYLKTLREKYLASNGPQDKFVIMDNMKGQSWFQRLSASTRLILTGLVDRLKLITEEVLDTETTKLLNLIVEFDQVRLHVHYYYMTDDLLYLQIYVKSSDHCNYLAYNIKGKLVTIPDQLRQKIHVPEIHDLCELMGLNETMVSPVLLLKFLLEIVLYYDETETLGLQKLSITSEQNINDLVETLNETLNETGVE